MNYLVYKHITPSGKVYIGITSRTLQQRKSSGYNNNPHFARAIKKYGWKNIQTEVLFENLTEAEAKEKEVTLIELYTSTNPNFGYNQSNGGESHSGCKFVHNNESKKKISRGLKYAYSNGLRNRSHRTGESNSNHILTRESVDYIRSHYMKYDRKFGAPVLAKQFSVSLGTIYAVVNNITWKDGD